MKKTNNPGFECRRCGYCCSDFGKSKTLPVFEFEIPILKKQAKNKGIVLVFVPENIFLDKKSGGLFCLNYGMAVMPCPFLIKEKKFYSCSIYKNRPLICRKFPLEKNPLFHDIKKSSFFDCNYLNSERLLKFVEKENRCLNTENKKSQDKIQKLFIEIFGKGVWDSSFKVDKIKTIIKKRLKELDKQGKTEITSVDWIDVKKHNVRGVFEFLEKLKQEKASLI